MLKNFLDKLRKPGKKGFTLIEVVIVLAIAGLIFVIVFLAVSQAQVNRRDTARKNDANRMGALLEQYASNNNGKLPTETDFATATSGFRSNYVTPETFEDPSSGTYTYQANLPTCTSSNAGTIGFDTTNQRTYTLRICLEKGEYEVTNS